MIFVVNTGMWGFVLFYFPWSPHEYSRSSMTCSRYPQLDNVCIITSMRFNSRPYLSELFLVDRMAPEPPMYLDLFLCRSTCACSSHPIRLSPCKLIRPYSLHQLVPGNFNCSTYYQGSCWGCRLYDESRWEPADKLLTERSASQNHGKLSQFE